MSLPIQQTAVYELTVPSTKKIIKYRPFLVKEEKALLLAEQTEEISVMVNTLKDVIKACTFQKLDTEDLAVFDLEYIMVKIRTKSVGETAELNIECEQCKKVDLITVDISKTDIVYHPNHNKIIPLFDDVGVTMKYPSVNILDKLTQSDNDIQMSFDSIIECIENIYDSNSIYHKSEQTTEELTEFLDNLTKEQFDKIQNFFETMPKVILPINHVCKSCGHTISREIEGIQNFF